MTKFGYFPFYGVDMIFTAPQHVIPHRIVVFVIAELQRIRALATLALMKSESIVRGCIVGWLIRRSAWLEVEKSLKLRHT